MLPPPRAGHACRLFLTEHPRTESPVTWEGDGGGPWQGWCASPQTHSGLSVPELPAPSSACSLPSSLSHARALPIAWLLLEPFLQTASVCVAIPPVTVTQTCLFIQPCSLGLLDVLRRSGSSVLVEKCPELCLVFGSLQFECAMPWYTCFGKRAFSFPLRAPTSVHTLPVSPQVRLLHPLEPWWVNPGDSSLPLCCVCA